MTYQVLARKWRPRVFEEIVGQPHVVTALANALDTKRLHHAYLFTGTRGVGKTTLARILAKALNCETGITSKPCGKCRACTDIDAGRFVDLLEVDAATNTKVDEMRELLDTAQYMPTSGRFKVYIIDEVHMLSRHAFNSMLKTLEEPPEHVKFILATTDPQRLPVTVLSRCLQFNLKPLLAAAHRRAPEARARGRAGALRGAGAGAARQGGRGQPARQPEPARPGDRARRRQGHRGAGRARCSARSARDLVWPLLERVAAADGKGAIAEAERIAERSISYDAALEDLAVAPASRGARAGRRRAGRRRSRPRCACIARWPRASMPGSVQVMYQIAILGRRDLALAPDEFAGFTMALLRMLSFAQLGEPRAAARPGSGAASRLAAQRRPPRPHRRAAAGAAAAVPRAPPPAASRHRRAAPAAAIAFDGDWPALVERLNLTGMAGMVARHGELASYENDHLELVVPETHRMYAEKAYQDKLQGGARSRISAPGVAPHGARRARTAGASLAAARRAKEWRSARRAPPRRSRTIRSCASLVRDLGAEVVPSSIRPAGRAAVRPTSEKR